MPSVHDTDDPLIWPPPIWPSMVSLTDPPGPVQSSDEPEMLPLKFEPLCVIARLPVAEQVMASPLLLMDAVRPQLPLRFTLFGPVDESPPQATSMATANALAASAR